MALRDKHIAAIDAYMLNGYNKKQALITAGYSQSTANLRAGLVFDREDVKEEIEMRRKRLAQRYDLEEDWVIRRLMDRADSGRLLAPYKKVDENGQLYYNFKGAPEDILALVQAIGIEYSKEGRGDEAIEIRKAKVQEPDAQAALMALARHMGMLNDKLEVKGGDLSDRIQAGRDRAALGKKNKVVH